MSPSSAYMYKRMPFLGRGEKEMLHIEEEFEYFEEDVIREGSDRY